MTLTTFSAGVNTSFSSQLNNNFRGLCNIVGLYTGTALTAYISSTSAEASTIAAYEFADIAASTLGGANYLIINTGGRWISYVTDTSDFARVHLKIETKDLGGAYASTFVESVIHNNDSANNNTLQQDDHHNLHWVHTLTANEKANGVKVKITYTAVADGGGDSGSIAIADWAHKLTSITTAA